MVQSVNNPPVTWETWVRSLGWEDHPGEGKGYPLQNSGLENSMDYIVPGVARRWTQLSTIHNMVRLEAEYGRDEKSLVSF